LAHPVEILDPQVEGAPAAAGQHPGEDRGAEVAQVQVAAGGGSVAAGAVGRGVSEHAERSGSRDGPAGRRRPVRRGPGGPRGRRPGRAVAGARGRGGPAGGAGAQGGGGAAPGGRAVGGGGPGPGGGGGGGGGPAAGGPPADVRGPAPGTRPSRTLAAPRRLG